MEDLAVFTALNHSGSFGKNSVKFQKNKYVISRLGGPHGEKLWPRSWKAFSRPRSQFFTIRTSHRKITYISFILFRKIKLFKVLSNLIIVAACIAQFAIWKILYTWNAISKFPNIFILRKFSLIFDNLKKKCLSCKYFDKQNSSLHR